MQYRDKQAILECLKSIGFSEVEVHEKPENLFGFQGDVREQQAHIIVRRKHIGGMSNDMGFRLNTDGTYDLVISQYDQGFLGNKINQFRCKYVERQITKKARYLGFVTTGKTVKGGKVHLRLGRA